MGKRIKSGIVIPPEFINTNKKYKNGLVLGKMYPFHLGHKHLIDSALQQCETVHVMVCSLKGENIYGWDRYNMVKDTYRLNDYVIVHHCDDENPQYPEECNSTDEFYLDYWNPSVMNRIPSLDAVFTSEEYGEEFAQYLGVEHVLIDIDRKTFPVSGTAVRNDINKNWKHLPATTKEYFKKKVVVMGSESCGKTTMIERLVMEFVDEFYPIYVEEYGRKYTEVIPTKLLDSWDFNIILKNHDRLIDYYFQKTSNMFLFIDTEAIVTKTFREMYLPLSTGIYKDPDFKPIIEKQQFDLILLLTPEVEWISDNTRDFPEQRQRLKHFELIKAELEYYGKPYVLITGNNYEDRIRQAREAVLNLNKI